jgi:integrase/recombinase XerD
VQIFLCYYRPVEITVYTRHSRGCPYENDRYSRRCRCRKWLQYQRDSKQVREAAKTRSWETAVKLARQKEQEDEQHRLGIAPAPDQITIRSAIEAWLKMRAADKRGNTRAARITDKILAWCADRKIEHFEQITTPLMVDFRLSLPYRTGDSNSLRCHWVLVAAFFRWAVAMGYTAKNPIPAGKDNPQFKITYRRREVEIPSKADIETAINAAEGKTKLMMLFQRWSGMAIGDAIHLERSRLTENLVRGNRRKTGERFRIRIPEGLADQIREVKCDDPNYFFLIGTAKDQVRMWDKAYRKVFKAAKVPHLHSHLFRHFRISELLAAGVKLDDVSLMVGTSPQELRRTYAHWIREQEDRLDSVQADEFKRHAVLDTPPDAGR